MIVVASFTALWYFTSSKNAVAIQHLVEQVLRSASSGDNDSDSATGGVGVGGSSSIKLPSPMEIMTILSIFQLLVGLCMAYPISFILQRKSKMQMKRKSKGKTQMAKAEIEETRTTKKSGSTVLMFLVIGALHFAGCLCTNLGFAFGSASLVQIVKLLEPIETMIFTAVITKSLSSSVNANANAKKTVSMFVILLGTAILLLQKSHHDHASINSNAIFFALCSGLCMAGRNTVVKKIQFTPKKQKQEQKDDDQEKIKNTIDWHVAALDGIQKFIQITQSAALVSILPLLISVTVSVAVSVVLPNSSSSSSAGETMISAANLLLSSGWIGFQSIIYHGLYNIASISVLCLVSAQSHSLLNVGKRVSNVLVAAIVFQEHIGVQGFMGLIIAAIGGFTYSYSGSSSSSHTPNRTIVPGPVSAFAFVGIGKVKKVNMRNLLLVLIPLGLFHLNSLFSSTEEAAALTSSSSSSSSSISSGSSHFLVWMFPFPPPTPTKEASKSFAVNDGTTLICAYSNACDDYKHHTKINLSALTKDTYFHNYVRDHAYHKVRHMKDFPFHIHAITMMSLLRTRPGACVSTLGSNEKFCDPEQFDTYDPYESVDLKSTNYPYPFVQSDSDLTNLFLEMDQENFAMWGAEDTPDNMKPYLKWYNSGEDVQSYASATWQPFISEIRPKFKALLNYTGYYIGNALVDGVLETSESDFKNMHKVSLLSIFADARNLGAIKPYLQKYTETIAPFGCRSTLTHSHLLAMKIKSYFSACLTLTTSMQGANLEGNTTWVHRYNIVKPNATELLPAENKTMILCVDVYNTEAVPPEILKRAHYAGANIAKESRKAAEKKMGRYDYSYKLLSIYANQAKVVITSRIHVGLPAAAMGIPVIFVSQKDGKLPGGKEKTGRVAGLLDIFHRLEPESGKNWTFGDLSGVVAPNPGNHLADRYRASFWNSLKKTDFYGDTARLYGMVPMQRLGQRNVVTNIQNKFHFVLNKNDLSWQTKRAIEHVFFFHPNSQVYVHSNDIRPSDSDLEVFVESGYDLIVQEYNINNLKEDAFVRTSMPVTFEDDRLSLYFLLLWKYGGVYVSKNTMIVKEIPLSLEDGIIMAEDSGNPAMAHLKKHSSEVFAFFKEIEMDVDVDEETEKQVVVVLSMEETHKCMEDESWALDSLNSSSSIATSTSTSTGSTRDALAVSLDPDTFASTRSIKFDSACFKIVEEPCIFCDEIHWDF